MKPKYVVRKGEDRGAWIVVDEADGTITANFTTKWEAQDFAAAMNEHNERN